MEKRMGIFLCVTAAIFGGLLFRVGSVAAGKAETEAAAFRSGRSILLAENRAGIFDRNLVPLVNTGTERRVLVFPEILETAAVAQFIGREELAEAFGKSGPSIFDLGGKIIEGEGIFNFSFPERYSGNPLAVHIIGYMNGGKGVSGIEKSFDEFLSENGSSLSVSYQTDGRGKLLRGEEIVFSEEETFGRAGVVLTLDSEIQRVAEDALEKNLEKGAAVVMDIKTGEIIASASFPEFDPSDIGAYLDDEDAPFINRAFSAYSVGSVWKPVVAAAALESGIGPEKVFECSGSVLVGERVFRCHWENGHGEIGMERALGISCNPYFINLGQMTGGERILETAKNLGFGVPAELGNDYFSAAGSLPSPGELSSESALASFSFGQGSLSATPLQVCSMVCAVANGGFSVTPKLVLGFYDREGNYSKEPDYVRNPVMSEKTAALLREMMIYTVEEGSGEKAKPKGSSAGGKTASAQTGQFDSEGNEIIHAWFAGFFPGENPQYAITVFAEGMNSGGDFAAPVFRSICEGIMNSRIINK